MLPGSISNFLDSKAKENGRVKGSREREYLNFLCSLQKKTLSSRKNKEQVLRKTTKSCGFSAHKKKGTKNSETEWRIFSFEADLRECVVRDRCCVI